MVYKVYNGAMEEKEIEIENSSIDLLLTDPPYNISIDNDDTPYLNWEGNTVHRLDFDHESDNNWDQKSQVEFQLQLNDWAKVWSDKLRKNGQFYIFTGDKYISDLWNALEKNGMTPKRVITWRKPNAVPFNRKALYISSCEYIIWGVKENGSGNKKKVFNATPEMGNIETDIIETEISADKLSNIILKNSRIVYSELSELFKDDYELIVDKIIEKSKNEMISSLARMRPDEVSYNKSLEKAKATFEIRKANAIGAGKDIPIFKNPETFDNKLRLVLPNIITYPTATGSNRIHPTEKPVGLLKYFISVSTNIGDTVLDTFGGSGSTGEASLMLKRKVILIEKEQKYYDNIVNRLSKLNIDSNFDNNCS